MRIREIVEDYFSDEHEQLRNRQAGAIYASREELRRVAERAASLLVLLGHLIAEQRQKCNSGVTIHELMDATLLDDAWCTVVQLLHELTAAVTAASIAEDKNPAREWVLGSGAGI